MCTGCALLFVVISLNLCEAENNRVVAWIGCRAGSRRLPNKNTLPFVGEETLIHVKLQQLLNVPEVDFVVFSSDDEKALQIAKEYEKQRPEKLAVLWRDECFKESVQPRQELCATEGECDADSCTSSEYMQFIARRLNGAPYDAAHIIYTPVTAPMYNESAISQQIRAHLREPNRGVVPVTSMSGYFYHREKPLTFSPDNCVATQSLDAVQWLTWPSMIGQREYIERTGWFGEDPVRMEFALSTVWEVNNEMEFLVAQTLYRRYVLGIGAH